LSVVGCQHERKALWQLATGNWQLKKGEAPVPAKETPKTPVPEPAKDDETEPQPPPVVGEPPVTSDAEGNLTGGAAEEEGEAEEGAKA
jgi:hypothetical protein